MFVGSWNNNKFPINCILLEWIISKQKCIKQHNYSMLLKMLTFFVNSYFLFQTLFLKSIAEKRHKKLNNYCYGNSYEEMNIKWFFVRQNKFLYLIYVKFTICLEEIINWPSSIQRLFENNIPLKQCQLICIVYSIRIHQRHLVNSQQHSFY